MFRKQLFLFVVGASLLLQIKAFAQNNNVAAVKSPKAMQEFRAAWIASVSNINWPSKPGLSTDEQQKEAITLLDLLKSLNFNAAILQVRPQADALYKSSIEPWSYFLTGTQGKAPNPYYDPLEFWVEAAHDRGIELHVWLNPYRAHSKAAGEESEASVVKAKPNLVVKLKDGQYWMDPSKKEVQDLSAAVVLDLVKRYDIDGVHFDDYFYPYDEYNGGADFPDSLSWAEYQQSGGKLSRGDWRRNSVNTFIERVYKEIKKEKKYVKFGISPFGTWRSGYPDIFEGFDQYSRLYADAKLWLNEGWLDYFTPQLYWTVNNPKLSFPVLLGWWKSENTKQRHLWPGMNIGLGGDDKNVDEVINQIMIERGMNPDSKGEVHWSIAALQKHEKLRQGLVDGPYKKQALVPATEWLNKKAPDAPTVQTTDKGDSLQISWTHPNISEVFRWVVYFKYADKWDYRILTRKDNSFTIAKTMAKTAPAQGTSALTSIAVTAVERTGNESKLNEMVLP